MPDVKLTIAGRDYVVACNPGEEQRLQTLGAMVDASAREAGGGSNGLNETRVLLFSALLLADKLHDANSDAGVTTHNAQTIETMAQSADALEGLATRLENLALRLEN
ncbi:cell division protein ZapA [Sphingorhabdus sp.]|uniref:cell division protein ZapA n=1 Tax=Sphingorhabdus sp. TaxID=1902408 RepID=UPI00391B1D8A